MESARRWDIAVSGEVAQSIGAAAGVADLDRLATDGNLAQRNRGEAVVSHPLVQTLVGWIQSVVF